MIISAAGNLEHARVRELVERRSASLSTGVCRSRPIPTRRSTSHDPHEGAGTEYLCLSTNSYPQNHDRYVSYIMDTVLGGSMSSRLFRTCAKSAGSPMRVQRVTRRTLGTSRSRGLFERAVEVIDVCRGTTRHETRAGAEAELRRARIISRAA
jgi:hypothetical protein